VKTHVWNGNLIHYYFPNHSPTNLPNIFMLALRQLSAPTTSSPSFDTATTIITAGVAVPIKPDFAQPTGRMIAGRQLNRLTMRGLESTATCGSICLKETQSYPEEQHRAAQAYASCMKGCSSHPDESGRNQYRKLSREIQTAVRLGRELWDTGDSTGTISSNTVRNAGGFMLPMGWASATHDYGTGIGDLTYYYTHERNPDGTWTDNGKLTNGKKTQWTKPVNIYVSGSQFVNIGSGKCTFNNGQDPKSQYLANTNEDQCKLACSKNNSCSGYSHSSDYDTLTASNCLLWLDGPLDGHGAQWGHASCNVKQHCALPDQNCYFAAIVKGLNIKTL